VSSPFSGNVTVVAAPDHLSTRLDDDVVILGLRDSIYYGLSGAGARVWDLLRSERTRDDIVAAIVAEYDVTAEAAAADIDALLAELHARGLIAIAPDPGA
jgi:hypothetical protein